jgi:hypothetical protein
MSGVEAVEPSERALNDPAVAAKPVAFVDAAPAMRGSMLHAKRRAAWSAHCAQRAQMRPTSRQRIQPLADELGPRGSSNSSRYPKHRRSTLVQLTPRRSALSRPQCPTPFDGIHHRRRSQPTRHPQDYRARAAAERPCESAVGAAVVVCDARRADTPPARRSLGCASQPLVRAQKKMQMRPQKGLAFARERSIAVVARRIEPRRDA